MPGMRFTLSDEHAARLEAAGARYGGVPALVRAIVVRQLDDGILVSEPEIEGLHQLAHALSDVARTLLLQQPEPELKRLLGEVVLHVQGARDEVARMIMRAEAMP
jgi:hypothetical protein